MSRSELEKAIAACTSADAAEQQHGLVALRELHAVEQIPLALSLLRADDPAVRSTAAATCAALAAAIGTRIAPLLEDPDPLVRSDALDAIAALKFRGASKVVEGLLGDEDAAVRASAAEALGSLGAIGARPSLVRALSDEDDVVRAFAASSLGRLGDSKDISLLESALSRETSPAVQAEIYAAEYRLGREDRLEPLLDIIASPDFRVATVAMNAMLDLIAKSPRPELYGKSRDISRALQAAVGRDPLHGGLAKKILAQLEGREAPTDPGES